MPLLLMSSATSEPVSVMEVRDHLRLSTVSDDEDAVLSAFITVARQQAENYMKRQIQPATWKMILDDFPGTTGIITLPRPPLSTVSTNVVITYTDDDTALQTLSSTGYVIDGASYPGKLYPTYGNEWPDDVLDFPNSVSIRYVSGLTAVPDAIKLWIKMRVGVMYENREPVITDESIRNIQRNYFDGLLDPFVVLLEQ